MERYPVTDHTFYGIGEIVLAIAGDTVADIGFQAIEQDGCLADAIDAHQRHIGFGDLGFFHDPLDTPIILQLGDAEITRVVYPFNAQKRMGLAEYVFDLVLADRIAQHDEDLVIANDMPGKQDGVTDALAFILVYKVGDNLGVFLFYKVLDLLAEVAYDKDEFGDAGFHQLVDDDGENGFSS